MKRKKRSAQCILFVSSIRKTTDNRSVCKELTCVLSIYRFALDCVLCLVAFNVCVVCGGFYLLVITHCYCIYWLEQRSSISPFFISSVAMFMSFLFFGRVLSGFMCASVHLIKKLNFIYGILGIFLSTPDVRLPLKSRWWWTCEVQRQMNTTKWQEWDM